MQLPHAFNFFMGHQDPEAAILALARLVLASALVISTFRFLCRYMLEMRYLRFANSFAVSIESGFHRSGQFNSPLRIAGAVERTCEIIMIGTWEQANHVPGSLRFMQKS